MSFTSDKRIEALRTHCTESADVKQRMVDECGDAILEAADLVADTFSSGGKLLLCGNGGSAADCQHMAAEFTSRLTMDFARPGLPAIALTCDTSFLTAYSNDFDFSGVFARQVQALGRAGDVCLGISTSGNSRNVIAAFEEAHSLGMKTIGLTGSGGKIKDLATVAVAVPSTRTQYVQEAHLAIEHVICYIVERAIYGEHGLSEYGVAA